MAERSSGGSLHIAIATPCRAWLRRLPDARTRCRRWVRAALGAGGFDPRATRAELSLVLGDDALLRRLNRDFRGIDKPTNVLSFPALEWPYEGRQRGAVVPLGDIAIAYDTTTAEAREQGKTLPAHLAHLVVHGVLHLLGYDHLKKAQAREMEILETVVLSRFGITDPYRARPPRARRRTGRSRR